MPTKIEAKAIEMVASTCANHSKALAELIEVKYPGAIARARARRAKEYEKSRFRGTVPPWARRLFLKHAPSRADLRWRRSSTTLRGTCDGVYSVSVTERIGTSEERMRILLLHEIAHFVGFGHDARYTAELRRLLVAEGLYRAALKSGLTGQSKLRRVKAATRPA